MLTSLLDGKWFTTNSWSVRLGKLLLVLASTIILGFRYTKIYDKDLCALLDMYMFRSGASSSMKGEVDLSV
jgi:hypothetical protein